MAFADPITRPPVEPLRVLLVIHRPGGRDAVRFRSAASPLLRHGADRMAGHNFPRLLRTAVEAAS